jgi:hypothetical protein
MGNGYPKRSWPTREWADEVWEKQHDRDKMDVYPCPVQPGFWHLGHRKEQSEDWKEHMFRLGFYMRCIGVQPQTCGRQAQYNALDPEQQKLARRRGRRLIKKAGTLAKAAAIFTTQIRDEQVSVTEHKNLQGGLLTEDKTEKVHNRILHCPFAFAKGCVGDRPLGADDDVAAVKGRKFLNRGPEDIVWPHLRKDFATRHILGFDLVPDVGTRERAGRGDRSLCGDTNIDAAVGCVLMAAPGHSQWRQTVVAQFCFAKPPDKGPKFFV